MWGPHVSGLSPYGTGHYSGNIVQGGVALQPQDYLLDGVTPMPRCIVITGAATVAPDSTTGAAVYMAHNLALIGASASLSASTNCKGLLGFVNGRVALRGGAHLHMNKLGRAGNFGDLSPDMLLPSTLTRRIATRKLRAYVVAGFGAAGGVSAVNADSSGTLGNSGLAAGAMQAGGGGSGGAAHGTSGHGGRGGPCGGGAGSGGVLGYDGTDAGDYGGPGSNALSATGSGIICGGGAGDPVGVGMSPGNVPNTSFSGQGAGGGLLALFAARLDVGASCLVSTDGATGGPSYVGGGSAGGGIAILVTKPGGYANSGTIRAAGGASVGTTYAGLYGGAGGAGSVNIFALAA